MSDKIFVSRDNNIYQIDMTSSGSLRDTDLVLASREVNGVPTLFKVTGDKFGKAPAAPEITDVILQQNQTNANRFTSNSFQSVVVGNEESPTASTLMTAEVEGALSIEAATEPIATNAYSTSTETAVPLTLDGTFNLGDVFEVNDVVRTNESYTPTTDIISSVTSTSAWNQDALWSNSLTCNQGFFGSRPKQDAFDGTTSEYAASNATAGDITFTSPVAFPAGCKVEVWCNNSSGARHDVFVNGGAKQVVPGGAWIELTYNAGDEAAFVILIRDDGSGNTNFNAIRINGVMLVDSNVPGPAPDGPNKIINLPTEKDIQLFQAGDRVQGTTNGDQEWTTYGSGNAAGSGYDWSNAFDGDQTSSNTTAADLNSTLDWEYAPGLVTNGDLALALGVDNLSNFCTCIVNAGKSDEVTVPVTYRNNVAGAVIPWVEVDNIPILYSIQLTSDSNIYIYLSAVRVNNLTLVDSSKDTNSVNSTVIATDVSAKTITVNGGNWDTSNQSQVWSSMTTASNIVTGTIQNIFNGFGENSGLPNSYLKIQNDGEIQFTPNTAFTNVDEFKICVSSSNSFEVTFNDDTANTQTFSGGGIRYQTISCPSTISRVKFNLQGGGGAGFYLSQIFINGQQLVDAANDSQVWSNYVSGTQFGTSYPITAAFDGNLSTRSLSIQDNNLTFQPPSPIPVNNQLRVYVKVDSIGNNNTLVVNGADYSNLVLDDGESWVTISDITEITTIIYGQTIGNGMELMSVGAFEVDGKLLIDRGARGLGDTEVSTVSPKRGEGTIKTINGTAVTIEPFVNNCFKEDQYLVFKTPKVVEVTPLTDSIDSFNSSTNTLTLSGGKDLNQLTNGDTVFMTDGTDPINQDGYTLTTTDIESVTVSNLGSVSGNAPNGTGSWENLFDPSTNLGLTTNVETTYYFDTPIPATSTSVLDVYSDGAGSGSSPVFTVIGTTGSIDFNKNNGMQGSGQQTASLNINVGDIRGFTARKINTSGYFDLRSLTLDGVRISQATVLNFPGAVSTNPDLQYFKPNDVVQGFNSYIYSPNGTITFPENAVDGDESTYSRTSSAATTIWETNWTNINSIEFKIYASSSANVTTITLEDLDGNEQTQYVEPGLGDGTWTTISNPPQTLRRMTIIPNENSETWIYIVKVNNELLDFSNNVKVISTGYAQGNNTMIVDGGDWDVSNQSRVWSNTAWTNPSSNANYGGQNAFDGNLDTRTGGDTTDYTTYTFDPPLAFTDKVRIYGDLDTRLGSNPDIKANNTSVTGVTDGIGLNGANEKWYEVLTGGGTLTSVSVKSVGGTYWGFINAIEVDGKRLVDKINDSQVWSAPPYFNQDGAGQSGRNIEDAFNGTVASGNGSWQYGANPPLGTTWRLDFTEFSSITKLEIAGWMDTNGNSAQCLKVNGTAVTFPQTNTGITVEVPVTKLENIEWKFPVDNSNFILNGIYVNGELLVNTGVRNLGESKVTLQTNGGQGTVDTVDTSTNSIVITPTGNSLNRWIGTNKAGTTFYAGSPTKPAISQKAYLKFTGAGVVESVSAAPVAPQAMESRNPTLIFPATFDTGTAPDAELPDPTSLKTIISRTNELGTATATSNTLFPSTTGATTLAAGAAATYTTDGYSEFVCMTKSHEGRAAEQRAIQYAENCQALKDAAEQKAQDYINDNP